MTEPLEYHPLANLFPLIEGKDFEEFCAGIKADGILHDKIMLLDGKILDGRNRYRACMATGVTPHFERYSETIHGEALKYVIGKNLHRRHLDESQRAMLAADLATMRQGERTDVEPSANLQKVSQAEAAKLTSVSPRSVASAVKVRNEGAPELREAVKQGVVPVSLAEQAVALPVERQRQIVNRARSGDASGAKGEVKKAAREAKERDLGARQSALPEKRYGVILADPEWRFEPWSRETGLDRAADNHYPTSALDVIQARPVAAIAAKDCVLFLWATAPMTPHALFVMAAWGFDYVTQFVWAKNRIGTGYWNRNRHEVLLVGKRGSPPAPAPGTQWDSLIEADVGEHSAKPEKFYELIEAYFPTLPKIELNARRARLGWDAWGLEAPDASIQADTGIGPVDEPYDPKTCELSSEPEAEPPVEYPGRVTRFDPNGKHHVPQVRFETEGGPVDPKLIAAYVTEKLKPWHPLVETWRVQIDDGEPYTLSRDGEPAEAASTGGDHEDLTPTGNAVNPENAGAVAPAPAPRPDDDDDIPAFLRKGTPENEAMRAAAAAKAEREAQS